MSGMFLSQQSWKFAQKVAKTYSKMEMLKKAEFFLK